MCWRNIAGCARCAFGRGYEVEEEGGCLLLACFRSAVPGVRVMTAASYEQVLMSRIRAWAHPNPRSRYTPALFLHERDVRRPAQVPSRCSRRCTGGSRSMRQRAHGGHDCGSEVDAGAADEGRTCPCAYLGEPTGSGPVRAPAALYQLGAEDVRYDSSHAQTKPAGSATTARRAAKREVRSEADPLSLIRGRDSASTGVKLTGRGGQRHPRPRTTLVMQAAADGPREVRMYDGARPGFRRAGGRLRDMMESRRRHDRPRRVGTARRTEPGRTIASFAGADYLQITEALLPLVIDRSSSSTTSRDDLGAVE